MAYTDKDGTWENEGEEWRGGSFNPDGSKRSEDWKDGRQDSPRPPQPQLAPDGKAAWLSRHHAACDAEDRKGAPAREREFARYPTLDLWLDAERAGKLSAPPIKERIGVRGLLSNGGRGPLSKYLDQQTVRLQRWPRPCRTCGKEFTGTKNARRCPACGGPKPIRSK